MEKEEERRIWSLKDWFVGGTKKRGGKFLVFLGPNKGGLYLEGCKGGNSLIEWMVLFVAFAY